MADSRNIKVDTPLGDILKLRSFSGREEMSRLFQFNLEMVCTSGEIKHDDLIKKLVGSEVTVQLDLKDGERHFHGHISRVASDYSEDGGTVYRAEMVPWLWFLTQTSDCRIFQDKTVKEILAKIFEDLSFKDYDDSQLKADYPKLKYCVQYRETDFNFVSRLMEQFGIFYTFSHDKKEHKLHLADSTDAYKKLPESTVDYPLTQQTSQVVEDHITSWGREIEFVSGKWSQTDYNFTTPTAELSTDTKTKLKHTGADKYEIYDYPGEYENKDIGKRETEVRMEEEEVPFDQVNASSTCRTFSPGGTFAVGKHPSESTEKQKFLITSIHHQASATGGFASGGSSGGAEYTNSFTCIPDSVVYRPARITPKPLVSGLQTAVVVGPKNEEIFTDEYGRVKVQFHWDREAKKEDRREKSSCFIRAAQSVAGKKWGFMAIPRIGQEVVVDFLEGDPDRPLIVGSVYNQQQMPHYDPKEHKAKSYIKTNSTKGGEGFNELMFDDKHEEERIFMHAQKDMDVRVRNDSKERIYGNRHQIIGWEKDGDKGGDQKEEVKKDKHIKVHANQVEHIGGDMQLLVGGVDGDGNQDVVIKKDKKLLVEADQHTHVMGNDLTTVDGNRNTNVGGDQVLEVAGSSAHVAGADHWISGVNILVEGQAICLKSGGNSITIDPSGVTIVGSLVRINSGPAPPVISQGAMLQSTNPTDAQEAEPKEPSAAHNSKTGVKSSPD